MSNPYATQQRSQLNSAPAEKAEGWALIETARRLEAAKQTPSDREGVLTAVRLNWRIWTIIQASLVEPDTPLPREIRENLLNLSRFIDRRSAELIAKPDAPEKLEVLININRQIGAGLMGNPGGTDAADRPAAPATGARETGAASLLEAQKTGGASTEV
ncbi:MAG: flagellar biosynthesis regulator FlaF [Alphaproteobacteria bacterium]|nr:flagellar biosynthesis regulator FlaF [Alphaproteobacteria bacterium]